MSNEILPENMPKRPSRAYLGYNIFIIAWLFLSVCLFIPYYSTIRLYIPALYNVGLYETVINNVYVVKCGDNPPKFILSNGEKVKFIPELDFLFFIMLVFFPCGFILSLIHIFIDNYICKDFEEKVRKYKEYYKVWETGKCTNNNLSPPITEKSKKLDCSSGSITWKFVVFILSKIKKVIFLRITCLEWIIILFIVLVVSILTLSYFW
jgi:hypothetical protein